jgi:hypothetical protein
VKRVDARIAVAGKEHHGRIGCATLYVVIGRVLEQIEELFFVFRGTVFRGPVRAHKKLLEAQHVQQRIAAPDG